MEWYSNIRRFNAFAFFRNNSLQANYSEKLQRSFLKDARNLSYRLLLQIHGPVHVLYQPLQHSHEDSFYLLHYLDNLLNEVQKAYLRCKLAFVNLHINYFRHTIKKTTTYLINT